MSPIEAPLLERKTKEKTAKRQIPIPSLHLPKIPS